MHQTQHRPALGWFHELPSGAPRCQRTPGDAVVVYRGSTSCRAEGAPAVALGTVLARLKQPLSRWVLTCAHGLSACPAGLTRRPKRCCRAEPQRYVDQLSWKTYRVPKSDDDLVAAIADELGACRQRGIERLDLSTHNQVPVQTPVLQALGSEYVTARQLRAYGRIWQLKYLLRDAIKAFAVENEGDAQLVVDLFFGDSLNRVTKSAGELLDIARNKSGYRTEMQFRQARRDAFVEFARFLPEFVEDARQGTSAGTEAGSGESGSVSVLPQLRVTPGDIAPDPEVQRHEATTGYVVNGEYFIRLLAEAANVTIVGFTNEKLASMLRAALERKRANSLRPDTCWDSLRIVFFSDELLDLVDGERREFPDRDEMLKQRRRAAVYGRRTVSNFLRSLPPTRWATYEAHFFPPLIGALFEMPNGQRIIQLLIRRPQRSAENHLYLQLEDTQGHYFSAAFEEIVHGSDEDTKVVPVGVPAGDRFRVTGIRYRHLVLKDGSRAKGWLPLVLVITWRMRRKQAEPLLQLRSPLNAARELGRLSHLSGHVLNDDRGQIREFGLEDDAPLMAARRRVQMETGEEHSGILRPLGTSRYIYPDKEHLFFFVYGCEFPEGFQPSWQSEMYAVSVAELMSVRENQALRLALSICESPPTRGQTRADAFEIVALNLTLHGHTELAREITNVSERGGASLARRLPEIRNLEEQTRQSWAGLDGQETVLAGLSGLQYREFFSLLLPYYANIGAQGASDQLQRINDHDALRLAVERLAVLYHDESMMEAIPREL